MPGTAFLFDLAIVQCARTEETALRRGGTQAAVAMLQEALRLTPLSE